MCSDSLATRAKAFGAAVQDKEVMAEFQRIHELVYKKENYVTEPFEDGPKEDIGTS